MNDILLIIFGLVLLVGMAVIIVLLRKKPLADQEKMAPLIERFAVQSEQLSQLQRQNSELRSELGQTLAQTHQTNQGQYEQTNRIMRDINAQSSKMIAEVTEKLTKLDETNRQVVGFSAQLQNLQDILKNPKQRGVLGEYYLEETLSSVLPPGTFKLQYSLGKDEKNNQELIVDAAIFVKEKIVPVDAKFSLENYERLLTAKDPETRKRMEAALKQDLKNRIDETSKYVRPNLGTLEFAFMFVPSESIYYDLLTDSIGNRDMIDYAFREKKVIIVSPTTFLAYLQTVLQGLRAMQIEERAQDIKKNVEKLGRHLGTYNDFLQKLGNSLDTSVNHYNHAAKEFKKIDKDILKVTGRESDVEILNLNKTRSDED
ncbi:DNA recombination protein RmuC [Candidatus Falkowbacteria bacterium]|jgi:DNA recombination protein RmuC|nr:DNA recombination protein RmuC [Patescibacteria group bacterium]MDD3435438.1 DNA recombination protein RmuC [Patescibacteria group bacterium]MDD4466719.1 DNA recombination protein RmuC [Patescibacteria group bacterium]NCU42900.1 DNA recombination protein RmuC [Candidatus Falkowbacteria bacterium]